MNDRKTNRRRRESNVRAIHDTQGLTSSLCFALGVFARCSRTQTIDTLAMEIQRYVGGSVDACRHVARYLLTDLRILGYVIRVDDEYHRAQYPLVLEAEDDQN